MAPLVFLNRLSPRNFLMSCKAFRTCLPRFSLLVVATVIAMSASVGRAGLLPSFPNPPGLVEQSDTNIDITTSGIAVSYNSTTQEFTAEIDASYSSVINNTYYLDPAHFLIKLKINNGVATDLAGDSLEIEGTVLPNFDSPYQSFPGDPSGSLLTGKISQFGFTNPQDVTAPGPYNFQFIFYATGGQLQALFSPIVVNLSGVQIADFGWDRSWSGLGQADTYSGVPEASSLVMWLAGALGMVGLQRTLGRRRQRILALG